MFLKFFPEYEHSNMRSWEPALAEAFAFLPVQMLGVSLFLTHYGLYNMKVSPKTAKMLAFLCHSLLPSSVEAGTGHT